MTAEFLEIAPDDYFRLPHFSSSRAKVLLDKSPAHARLMREKISTRFMDFGSVGHRLVLGRGKDYKVLEFGDYRTNASKAARDEAKEQGLVPILAEAFVEAGKAAVAVRDELEARGIVLDGVSEAVVTWEETASNGVVVPCKAMFDHVWFDDGIILDLKFTENAAPSAIERTAENLNYALQATAYTRALARLNPRLAGRTRFLFAFAETDEPYALNLVEPDGMFAELGERRWLRAVETWATCVAKDAWPAYGTGVNSLSSPQWALTREDFTV
jgi:hypothetical protein